MRNKNYKNCDIECGRTMAWKVLKVIGMVILGIAVSILFGFIVMWLWNWLMPEIFGLTTLTYWQAIGIFILSKIVFGGFGGGWSDSESKGHKGPKGVIREEIGKEIRKEFDKEFDKEYDKEVQKSRNDDDKDSDYDELYEKWWSASGEKNFNEYMDKSEPE